MLGQGVLFYSGRIVQILLLFSRKLHSVKHISGILRKVYEY